MTTADFAGVAFATTIGQRLWNPPAARCYHHEIVWDREEATEGSLPTPAFIMAMENKLIDLPPAVGEG